jgi:hypothetical protein
MGPRIGTRGRKIMARRRFFLCDRVLDFAYKSSDFSVRQSLPQDLHFSNEVVTLVKQVRL